MCVVPVVSGAVGCSGSSASACVWFMSLCAFVCCDRVWYAVSKRTSTFNCCRRSFRSLTQELTGRSTSRLLVGMVACKTISSENG